MAGCGEDSDSNHDALYPTFAPNQSSFSDQELRQAVYSGYKYPTAFYRESLDGSIHYENTWSLVGADEREFPPRPLCTDDPDTALAWSEAGDRNSSVHRTLVDVRETTKYFEFKRAEAGSHSFLLSRISKCGYFRASQIPFLPWEGGRIGDYRNQPPTNANVRELSEYLWFIAHYDIGGSAALSSFSSEPDENGQLSHVIFDVRTVYGDYGVRDHITLRRLTFAVVLADGRVFYEQEDLRTIEGRENPNPW